MMRSNSLMIFPLLFVAAMLSAPPQSQTTDNPALLSPDGGKTWEVNWICELSR